MENPKFEDLPKMVFEIQEQLRELKEIVLMEKTVLPQDQWMDLDELMRYDPEKRTKATFYSYTRNPESGFPFHKRGKRILVLKSEFDQWIKEGRKNTDEIVDHLLLKNHLQGKQQEQNYR